MQCSTRVIFRMAFNYPCPRKLREVMKLSAIERESPPVIKRIWQEYHEPRVANIAHVIAKDKYVHLQQKANRSPMFLLPVFRGQGHFKLLTQWQSNCFLATFLDDFKRQGTSASPYVVFTLFPQLLFQKGIVLLRGDILGGSLTKPEADQIWTSLEAAYTEETQYQRVNDFNHNPDNFDFADYNQAYRINDE